MTDHDALLAAVLDRPDDDTPRMVFADYLDDVGDHERAALIREQIEIARSSDGRVTWRACELRAQLPEPIDGFHAWANPASCGESAYPRKCLYVRGFVEEVTCPAADWLDHGDAIVKAHPVRAVTLTTVPELQSRYGDHRFRVSFAGDDGRAFVERYTVPNVWSGDEQRQTVAFLLPLRWPRIAFTLPPPVLDFAEMVNLHARSIIGGFAVPPELLDGPAGHNYGAAVIDRDAYRPR